MQHIATERDILLDFRQPTFYVRAPPAKDSSASQFSIFSDASEAQHYATECLAPLVQQTKQDLAGEFLRSLEDGTFKVLENGVPIVCDASVIRAKLKVHATVVMEWVIEASVSYVTLDWKSWGLVRSYLAHKKGEVVEGKVETAPATRKRKHSDSDDDTEAHSPALLEKIIQRFAHTSVLDSIATDAVRSEIGEDYGIVTNLTGMHVKSGGTAMLRVSVVD